MAEAGSNRREFLRWLAASGTGVALSGLLSGTTTAAASEPAADEIVVITRVTLIDGTGSAPRRDVSVVLVGDRIAWVGTSGQVPDTGVARVIDGRGKYLIPGLWDMHTHGADLEEIVPPLHLVHGVTGGREMWGYAENRATRDRIERGELLGPRLVVGSGIVDGPVTLLGPPVIQVSTDAEARAAVRAEKTAGAEFVKIYSYLGAEALRAVADEVRHQGLRFSGHWPYKVSHFDASDLGQHSFEHFFGVSIHCSSRRDEILARLAATPFDPAAPRDFFNLARRLEFESVSTYSPTVAWSYFGRLRRNGTWHSPTLTINRIVTQPAGTHQRDPRLKYVPADIRESWAVGIERFAPKTLSEIALQERYYQDTLRLVGVAHEAGVGIIGGTDCLNPYTFPGSGLHEELAFLVEAGLSPVQALKTVTGDAAKFLGREHTSGTVTAGKEADLVLLEANPAADIRNVAKIDLVITRGRVLDKTTRQRMLDAVEAAANRPAATAANARIRSLARRGCCC
ncbi:amidohydrolase family protein [Amycolatopsis regifaucium]|uniref:Amidohydrolase n=1 Tax=Amycolatopsis regifaucium TaxID=546365 RepID=A0A154MJB0_9PSEU|nr:amidohydrolase family protein [Amycolatopsis regifaucium]KZB84504.1 amidohydrolase [Amycolatopsis regifaucium]OKA10967.1 amidohydrolase [Amycolatopsis regifaucium]SFI23766.1 Amidohydrolase family protein [Amycolatopsis regifaucium]